MGHERKTDLPKATGLTMAICGFATLALATVLGFSLASGATDALGGDASVTIVIRPPAADAAIFAGATPFEVASCTTAVAARC